eukprot:s1463_g7.t1
MTRSTSSTDPAEDQDPPAINQADKKHIGAFNFAFNFYEAADYFAVRGEKRRGLIIDPGAASGLIGCDTLKDIIENCIQPYGKDKDIIINKNVTSPVSGISGGSDRTLGQVTLPLVTGGCPISFTGEVIGGEGSMCPALVGNPSLRKMNSTIFTNFFTNGDGLLVLDSRADDDSKLKMLRILLTDSGHYILPTDHNNTAKVSNETQQEVAVFWNKVASESRQKWNDVSYSTSLQRLCLLRRHWTRKVTGVNLIIHQKFNILPKFKMIQNVKILHKFMMVQNVIKINYFMKNQVEL